MHVNRCSGAGGGADAENAKKHLMHSELMHSCIPAFLALKMVRVPPAWLNYAMQASSSKLCTDCWIGCKRALDYDVAQPIHQKWKSCTNQGANAKYWPVTVLNSIHSIMVVLVLVTVLLLLVVVLLHRGDDGVLVVWWLWRGWWWWWWWRWWRWWWCLQEERCVTSDQLLLALVEKGRTRASKVLLAECTHVPVATVLNCIFVLEQLCVSVLHQSTFSFQHGR